MNNYKWIIILALCNFCSGQILSGARQTGLSYSDIALTGNIFSLFSNPAGVENISNPELAVFYSPSPFGMKELSTGYAAVTNDFEVFRATAGYSIYGFELYKENSFYLGLSKTFSGRIYTGFTLSLTNISIKNYGSTSVFRLNLGMIYSVSEFVNLGFTIQNLTRSKVKNDDKPMPVCYDFGVSVFPIKDISVNIAAEKEIYFETSFRFGIEYRIIEYLALRSGLTTEPDTFSAGMGIYYSFLNISYAFRNHNELGMTHQIELVINFPKD